MNLLPRRRSALLTKAALTLALSLAPALITARAATNAPVAVGTVLRDCPDCPDMVAIPQLGHGADKPGTLLYASKYEISWRQYLVAVKDGTCPPLQIRTDGTQQLTPESYAAISDDYPLTLVSPDEFGCYLKWLKTKTGFDYRIPSAAEWEHLARAGTSTLYPWGDDLGFDRAAAFDWAAGKKNVRHYDIDALALRYGTKREDGLKLSDVRVILQSDEIWPVGSFPPNAWGLHDVIGNAEEVTTEPSSVCKSWKADRSPCPWLSTRGPARLPAPDLRAPDFSLTTWRGATTKDAKLGAVGFRLIRS